MAIYHIDFKLVKRSEGKSSCAKAAYHARCKIVDDRTGNTYDFSKRKDLYHHLILSPPQTPAHIIENSSALWNEVERTERQKNGQTARYFDVAIPVELKNEDKIKLVVEYCQKNFVDKGMIADIAFHDLDSHNPHAHVMLTLKDITPDGFSKKNRDWNEHSLMEVWRSSWTTITNTYLAHAGTDARIDHRTLKAQREEAIVLAKEAQESGNEEIANKQLARAIELNRPALTYIDRRSWRTAEAKALRATEQAQVAQAKLAANDFRQLFNSNVGHYITVNIDSFRIEKAKLKAAPQQPIQRSPEPVRQPVLTVPERKRHFKPVEVRSKDTTLYYGIRSKTEKPTLLRRKRKINLRKLYDFIKTFLSVLVKLPVQEAEKPGGSITPKPPVHPVDDPLDEVMIDPVTKLKITRRQWEAMGTTRKSVEVSKPADANYEQKKVEKRPTIAEPGRSIAFPPLPKESKVATKSKGFPLPRFRFGSGKRNDE
ncbi:MobQ family relaxase [Raoultella ornithinolytica]|uniref:MobQ family relaxase n=1 Tax=Raoultella ornithinolytica TaxID=54291 RepID=UPI00301C9C47